MILLGRLSAELVERLRAQRANDNEEKTLAGSLKAKGREQFGRGDDKLGLADGRDASGEQDSRSTRRIRRRPWEGKDGADGEW